MPSLITWSRRWGNLIVVGSILPALCPLLSSTGLGKFCLLWRMHLVLTLVLVFFSLLLGFIIPGVKVNNKKLA